MSGEVTGLFRESAQENIKNVTVQVFSGYHLNSYKTIIIKGEIFMLKKTKMLSIILALAMLSALLPALSASALNGAATVRASESNIAGKYWVTATASSNAEDAGLAIDGNPNTTWIAADETASLTVDLSGAYNAVRKTEVKFIGENTIYKYKLEGSTDGEAWFALADRTGNTRAAEGFTDIFSKAGIRFLKVTITGGSPVGIKDFKVFNYLRPDMDNGSDIGSLQTGAFYYNANNSPPQMMLDGSRQIRGGTGNAASMNTGNNFYGLTKDMGWDTIRIRIWNDPRSEGGWATPGVWDNGSGLLASFPTGNANGGNSPNSTRTHARYIVGAGQNLAIDFHYADSWADPQNQPKPYAWVNLPWGDPEEPLRIPNMTVGAATVPATYNPNNDAHHKIITRGLVSEVYHFTYEMIESLIAQGTAPTIIAIGNEISHGMMWGKEYRLTNHYSATETYNDHHDYYHRFIRDNEKSILGTGTTYAQRYATSTIIDREDMPYGGGVEWMSYAKANGDKNSEAYKSFLESVRRLSVLIDAGQRAIYDLNEKHGLEMQTEIHFANNVFAEPRGGSKVVLDPDTAFEKFITLVSEINNSMKDMSGFPDRIGISYYPDWHGTYAMLEKNIVELQKVVPTGTKFNISECSPGYSGTVNNWINDPNLVGGPASNPNPWVSGLPNTFTRTMQYMADYTVDLLNLINNVPGNAGMGVWPWNGQSVYGTGGTLRAGMLAFTHAHATGVVESGIYITTPEELAPALPATVKELNVATGETSEAAVSWNAVNPASFATPGTFTVTGTAAAKGNMNAVTAYVTVVERLPITSLAIGAPAVTTVVRGSTYNFDADVNEGALTDKIVWTVNNASFAIVNNDNSVTILNKTGTVILTATDPVNGKTNSIILRIV